MLARNRAGCQTGKVRAGSEMVLDCLPLSAFPIHHSKLRSGGTFTSGNGTIQQYRSSTSLNFYTFSLVHWRVGRHLSRAVHIRFSRHRGSVCWRARQPLLLRTIALHFGGSHHQQRRPDLQYRPSCAWRAEFMDWIIHSGRAVHVLAIRTTLGLHQRKRVTWTLS